MASVLVGVGKSDLTPPIGTPSAGYTEQNRKKMQGIHDPLQATAIVIDNGEKLIAFCGVDHLGFTYGMVQEVVHRVHQHSHLATCEIYIGSSHTHSGGGAFLNLPVIGEMFAGQYNPDVTQFYINQAAEAIIEAGENLQPAKIGIGYGQAPNLSLYRGLWPTGITPLPDVAVIKVTRLDGFPLAVLFNYPLHPTILAKDNVLFSADFVGAARNQIKSLLGVGVEVIYFNGAQGDIIPNIPTDGNRWTHCETVGESLAETILKIWHEIETKAEVDIVTRKETYAFTPMPTPFDLRLPIEKYTSEINLIVLNHRHAFVTVPGELSCLYDARFKQKGKELGFAQVSILGLVNDAHGYIILPESWRHKTYESTSSYGGEMYGAIIEEKVIKLMSSID